MYRKGAGEVEGPLHVYYAGLDDGVDEASVETQVGMQVSVRVQVHGLRAASVRSWSGVRTCGLAGVLALALPQAGHPVTLVPGQLK